METSISSKKLSLVWGKDLLGGNAERVSVPQAALCPPAKGSDANPKSV